jgi:hypothetical protein
MTTSIRLIIATSAVSFLLITNSAYAETITATCYGPTGIRIDYVDGKKDEGKDGYSNSNPTFFFTTSDPEYLVESWQAALPFPELIGRERVDEILPPTVTKSLIVYRTNSVIHALSIQGQETFTTTLYLADDVAIFTRIRLKEGGSVSGPMGAIYTANCNISVLD